MNTPTPNPDHYWTIEVPEPQQGLTLVPHLLPPSAYCTSETAYPTNENSSSKQQEQVLLNATGAKRTMSIPPSVHAQLCFSSRTQFPSIVQARKRLVSYCLYASKQGEWLPALLTLDLESDAVVLQEWKQFWLHVKGASGQHGTETVSNGTWHHHTKRLYLNDNETHLIAHGALSSTQDVLVQFEWMSEGWACTGSIVNPNQPTIPRLDNFALGPNSLFAYLGPDYWHLDLTNYRLFPELLDGIVIANPICLEGSDYEPHSELPPFDVLQLSDCLGNHLTIKAPQRLYQNHCFQYHSNYPDLAYHPSIWEAKSRLVTFCSSHATWEGLQATAILTVDIPSRTICSQVWRFEWETALREVMPEIGDDACNWGNGQLQLYLNAAESELLVHADYLGNFEASAVFHWSPDGWALDYVEPSPFPHLASRGGTSRLHRFQVGPNSLQMRMTGAR